MRARAGLRFLVCLLVVPVQTAAGAQARGSAPNSAAVTEIRLERNCFGCPSGSVLVLQRDGAATLMTTGNARFGTASRTSRGRVAAKDFSDLTGLLTSQRFFELGEEYADPQLQDGNWSAITATRGGQEKVVRQRNGAGPAAIGAILRAIEAVQQRITWQADPQ